MHLKTETRQGQFQALFKSEKIVWFFLTGVLATLTDLGLVYFFTSYLGVWYLASASVSYCCGIIISYWLNKFLTFHDRNRNYIGQFLIFAAISTSCLVLNLGILWLMVEFFSVHYMIAKIFGISSGFLWNYYWQSKITFRNSESQD
jgi:putative flippase GtrA